MSIQGGRDPVEGSSRSLNGKSRRPSLYEMQKRRDWDTFSEYLSRQTPPVPISKCHSNHVLQFLQYVDRFGKTKVHLNSCLFYGKRQSSTPCTCPIKQAWGSLDSLIGHLKASFDEIYGYNKNENPFASASIRIYLNDVKDSQSKARGILYQKKRKMENFELQIKD